MSNEFLALYGPDGKEVRASRNDLLSIEGMSFDRKLHRRVVNDRSGRYWLISDRPGYHAMLLEVSIFHCYPRTGNDWSVSYGTNGIAQYAHFDLEAAIRTFKVKQVYPEHNDSAPLPDNVARIARQHVRYRLGVTPGEKERIERVTVRCRKADELRHQLNQFAESGRGSDTLLRALAGKRADILELVIVASDFISQNGLPQDDDTILQLMKVLVVEGDHAKLRQLLERS